MARRGELPATARPYLIEMHPDRGHASLALCAYDLLSGVLDGINSEGLTVSVLSDYEIQPEFPIDPAEEGGVGLDELQVLRMIAAGKTIKEIAAELSLSEKTIGTYRTRISEKMGLGTNVELTRYAIRHGLAD